MRRLHTTNSTSLLLKKRYIQTPRNILFKPTGLWYSLDNEWFEWCEGNDFSGVGKYTYELEVDLTNVLIVETTDDLLNMLDKYHDVVHGYYSAVNWKKVGKDYSGCEIRNYHHLKFNNPLPIDSQTWFWGWDVSSGCIWDLSIVSSLRRMNTKPILIEA